MIDAAGLVIAPGFIDLHMHGQTIPSMRMPAFDGVTTALELEAGNLPISLAYEVAVREGHPLNYGFSASWALARMSLLDNVQLDGTYSVALANLKAVREASPSGLKQYGDNEREAPPAREPNA